MIKYKKNILLFIVLFMSIITFNREVEAKVDPNGPYCYYSSDNLNLKIHQKDLGNAYIDSVGFRLYGS